jgi:hypothetical protein
MREQFEMPEQTQPQQPGGGESQNTLPPPFFAQGSQPPRVPAGKKSRVQQNRYAVPNTMNYSESSQAEAGQQIDRMRQNFRPGPAALLNRVQNPPSNPSNAQNIRPPVMAAESSEGNNEQTAPSSESVEEMFQQFTNEQQEGAQPGVPPTHNLQPNEEGDHNANENDTVKFNFIGCFFSSIQSSRTGY